MKMNKLTNKLIKFSLNICALFAIASIFLFGVGYDKFLPTIDKDIQTTSIETISIPQTPIQEATQKPTAQKTDIQKNTTSKARRQSVNWSKVRIDKVMVYKKARRMDLLENGNVIKSYQTRLGFNPIGHKTTEGDGKTPEGTYTLDWRNPKSQFYRSLHISYPNKQDLAQAKKRGVSAGGDVMVHGSAKKTGGNKGQPFYNYLPRNDWTFGCVSVSNSDMDEIWDNVKNGTSIEILP